MFSEEAEHSVPTVGKDEGMDVDATQAPTSPLSDGTHSNPQVEDGDGADNTGYASDSGQAKRVADGMSADPSTCEEEEAGEEAEAEETSPPPPRK